MLRRSLPLLRSVVARPSDLVGNTPLLDLTSLFPTVASNGATLLAKMESLGPLSSVKDRLGKSMIDTAEKDGACSMARHGGCHHPFQ